MRLFICALVCALGVGAARAQPVEPTGDKKQAQRRLAEGDRKLARGDRLSARGRVERAFEYYEEALVAYQAALAAYPDPQIYFPIAQAEQRLGRFVDALEHYQQLLDEFKSTNPRLEQQVHINMSEVKKSLAAVVITAEPDGAAILIDGDLVADSPMSQPVFVEPGQHTYAVTFDGYTPVEGKLDLGPGDEWRREVALERPPVAAADRGTADAGQTDSSLADRASGYDDRPSATPLWIGIGVTGALVVSGAITGFAALSKHSTFQDEEHSGPVREEARQDGKQLAGITDILLGAAVVGAAVTTYYYYGVYRPGQRERSGDKAHRVTPQSGLVRFTPCCAGDEAAQAAWFRIAPYVGEEGAGLAATGWFW